MHTNMQRTNHPKFTTYWGDGHGRDHYITFNNGGLQQQRVYGSKSTKRTWQDQKFDMHRAPTAASSPKTQQITAIRYYGDGSSRDQHVVFCNGQIRAPGKNYRLFENGLRQPQATPLWEQKNLKNNASPKSFDPQSSMFKNWQSPSNRQKIKILVGSQRASIERLSGSSPTNLGFDAAGSNIENGQTFDFKRRAGTVVGSLRKNNETIDKSIRPNSNDKLTYGFIDNNNGQQIKNKQVVVRERPDKMNRGSFRTMTPSMPKRRMQLATPEMMLESLETDNGHDYASNRLPSKIIPGTISQPANMTFQNDQLFSRPNTMQMGSRIPLNNSTKAQSLLKSRGLGGTASGKTPFDSSWSKGAPLYNVAQLEKHLTCAAIQTGKMNSAFQKKGTLSGLNVGHDQLLDDVQNSKIVNQKKEDIIKFMRQQNKQH